MRASRIAALIALLLLVAACGGGSRKATPTAGPGLTPTLPPGPTASGSIQGSSASDGICQITIPDTWIDDGTGRGVTATADHWSVFGGTIAGDAGWSSAKDLMKTQLGKDGATIDDSDDTITIVQPNGHGYAQRARFVNIYCEFSMTTSTDRGDDVVAGWREVAATMGPVSGK
jgi:hypothetical protein